MIVADNNDTTIIVIMVSGEKGPRVLDFKPRFFVFYPTSVTLAQVVISANDVKIILGCFGITDSGGQRRTAEDSGGQE
jgi:hypothetical protein